MADPSGIVHRFTDIADGDLAVLGDRAVLDERRSAVMAGPWTWLRQVHGASVVVVEAPGDQAGAEADAAVTAVPGAVLAIHTADCGPLLLDGGDVLGVVHAGWRGVAAGVIEATAEAMAGLGSPPVRGVLGPLIRPRCYEFDGPALEDLAERYGPAVRSETAWGTPAMDVGAAVAEACSRLGVSLEDGGTCTACSPRHWSHRARGDAGRQALVAMIQPSPSRSTSR